MKSIVTKLVEMGIIIGGLLSFSTVQSVRAATFTESGDAGNQLATAQNIGSISEQNNLIDGYVSPENTDLYGFSLANDWRLTASAVGFPNDNDIELFLFDGSGAGIIANDDSVGFESTLSASLTAGNYYLGIGGFNTFALAQNGVEWDFGNPPGTFDTLQELIRIPDDNEGSGGEIIGERVFSPGEFNYDISLSLATPNISVPESSSILGLLLIGAGLGITNTLRAKK